MVSDSSQLVVITVSGWVCLQQGYFIAALDLQAQCDLGLRKLLRGYSQPFCIIVDAHQNHLASPGQNIFRLNVGHDSGRSLESRTELMLTLKHLLFPRMTQTCLPPLRSSTKAHLIFRVSKNSKMVAFALGEGGRVGSRTEKAWQMRFDVGSKSEANYGWAGICLSKQPAEGRYPALPRANEAPERSPLQHNGQQQQMQCRVHKKGILGGDTSKIERGASGGGRGQYKKCFFRVYKHIVRPYSCMNNLDYHQFDSSEEPQEEKHFPHMPDSLSPTPTPAILMLLRDSQENLSPDAEQPVVEPRTPRGTRRGPRGSGENKNVNRGHWSVEENKKYHWFLQIHYRHFVNRHMRRMDKIFKTMEQFIGSRQAEQCRSHHQKMEKKYHNFLAIISNLRNQHYQTLELQPIYDDMQDHPSARGQLLASFEELTNHQEATSPVPEIKERKKSTSQRVERPEVRIQPIRSELERIQPAASTGMEEEKEEEDFEPINLLDDSNIQIGDISIYHEKDSGLFNQVFGFH